MYDESLALFLENMGDSSKLRITADSQLYVNKLPDKLLEFWDVVGWGNFANGLLWLTNPADYDVLVELWLEGTCFDSCDYYRVIARSAFGTLYAIGENTHQIITIKCYMHTIFAKKKFIKKVKNSDITVQVFFALSEKERFDLEDINGKSLFEQALDKLGPLSVNEVYGFEPALILGGQVSVDNLAKLNMDVHLTILRQLGVPETPLL